MSDWRRHLMHPIAMGIMALTAGLMLMSYLRGRPGDMLPQFFLGAALALLIQRQIEVWAYKARQASMANRANMASQAGQVNNAHQAAQASPSSPSGTSGSAFHETEPEGDA